MKRPDPEELKDFFRTHFLDATGSKIPHLEKAVSAFYKRFDVEFDQLKYNEMGIHINRIVREAYIIKDQDSQDQLIKEVDTQENITTIFFSFMQKPELEFSFILWGDIEEKPFFSYSKDELIVFFELKFRRFSNLLIR
jgi:hypothetical protein